jgi:hypothetical protein
MNLSRKLSRGSHLPLPITHFKEMSDKDRDLYTQVLSCHPESKVPRNSQWFLEYAKRTKQEIKGLPPHLREYPGWLERRLNKHIEDDQRYHARVLCPLHDQLNRTLLKSTLHWIKKEIDLNIPAVLSPLAEAGLLSEKVFKLFTKLTNVSAMWVPASDFESFYKRKVDPKWEFQNDHCPACLLARIGRDAEALTALKAGMLIRAKPDEVTETSRRMLYINSMIDRLPSDNTERIKEDARNMGRSLQIILKRWKAGREPTSSPSRTPKAPAKEPKRSVPEPSTSVTFSIPATSPPAAIASPVSPRDSSPSSGSDSNREYTPASWRANLAKANRPRDTIDELIDQYRRATLEPRLGRIDHFRSNDGDEEQNLPTSPLSPFALESPMFGSFLRSVPVNSPQVHESETSDIRSLHGSIHRTDSTRRRGAESFAREYQDLIGVNNTIPSSSSNIKPLKPVKESRASGISRASSAIEGNFHWDKVNLGSKEDVASDSGSRLTQWSDMIQSPQPRSVDSILGYPSSTRGRKNSQKAPHWSDALRGVSEESD